MHYIAERFNCTRRLIYYYKCWSLSHEHAHTESELASNKTKKKKIKIQ